MSRVAIDVAIEVERITGMQPTNIARPSVASLVLQTEFGGTALSTATGFLVTHAGINWLVTNWHVVTGRRPDTGVVMSSTGGVPDQLRIMHNASGQLGSWVPRLERLYDRDGRPLWLEHPRHGRAIDVVILRLTDVTGIDIYPHDPWAQNEPEMAIDVTRTVSIIGFPFGITGGGLLGVWVQGTIATEPAVDWNDLPRFLIDSRTRPGQSGSPVIAYHSGGSLTLRGGATAIYPATLERFLGVYSGRINDQSDLGIVWKAEALREIVEGGVRGQV